MVKKKLQNRGAPVKQDKDKVGKDGLKKEQQQQLRDIARSRNISIASVKREAIEWYLDEIEAGKQSPIANTYQLLEAEEDKTS